MKRIDLLAFLLLVALPAIQAAAQPAGLPPLPEWCDGTCVIDIAFFYAPEAIGQTDADVQGPDARNPGDPYGPQTVGELRADVLGAVVRTNILFRHAGLDAELRFVGLERDPGLAGLRAGAALDHVRRERFPHARSRYGADLVSAITADFEASCTAYARSAGVSREWARSHAASVLKTSCLGDYVLAHQVGYNLGLLRQPGQAGNQGNGPFVPFGHGYEGQGKFGMKAYGSVMAVNVREVDRFSTVEPVYGRVLGDANVSDAVRALRYTIPEAARYTPTVIPERVEDPRGYGCRPSASRACLNERRFDVGARYSTDTAALASAKRLDIYGLGDSAALFYFFEPDNPEMLLKVVDGCWLNDHWWVFGSAATDLAYEVAIEDLADGGGTVEYRHNGGGVIVADNGYSTSAGVITDTSAFPCGESAAKSGERRWTAGGPTVHTTLSHEQHTASGIVAARDAAGTRDYGCSGGAGDCLNNWRFSVSATPPYGGVPWGPARLVPVHGLGNAAALLYFFEPDNPEMLLKVVDGCEINGHWWVFGSAATDLPYQLRVDDWATAKRVSGGVDFRRWNLYEHHGEGRITRRVLDFGFIKPPHDGGYSTQAGVINDTTAFPCDE
ncbi:MAG: hypothetical protein F4112_00580 [Holophagales bacterium]|nr:hypothetical protein [Holophagales bacterium]MYD23492.1 hypothetical protein [Holophagales bacterium]MYI31440.1 hypothetical protein [Holophagales bacterium]